MLTAIAAATWSGVLEPPWLVFADGVAGAVLVPPPTGVPTLFASPRWSWAVWSTDSPPPVVVREGSSSAGAPAAEAMAWASVVELPLALRATGPPEVTERSRLAVVVWMAIVSASEKPTAALVALAEPFAWVSALAAWVADIVRPPAPMG